MVIEYISSIKNERMSTFWAQKVATEKSMKFTRFL